MKRHPSLTALSREHHSALILAQLLKKGAPAYKGLPVAINARADYALLFYRNELMDHFHKEEEVIIKKIKGIDDRLDKMAGEIISEHKELGILFTSISTGNDLVTHLDKLGCALERHIRKEEREFFPMVQELCSEKLLLEIEQALAI